MKKRSWGHLLVTAVSLVGYAAAMVRVCCAGQIWMMESQKRQVEIIALYPEGSGALAAELGEQYEGLFTFSFPEDYRDQATLRSGTILEVMGSASMKITSPAQLGRVERVKRKGERPDFTAAYYSTLKEKYRNRTREELWQAVDALEDLNQGEKDGLMYLLGEI